MGSDCQRSWLQSIGLHRRADLQLLQTLPFAGRDNFKALLVIREVEVMKEVRVLFTQERPQVNLLGQRIS